MSTMNYDQARFNMVEQQIRPWEVLDQTVLDLFLNIKREDFVPQAYRDLAFADLEIPLGYGATMLQPKVEARLLQSLRVGPKDHVLEIGTGSGYMAALLAARAERVVSVEIFAELAQMARYNLTKAGVGNVTVEIGDGSRGWAAGGQYDVICVTGSIPVVPPELLAQLKVGGRLAAFVGREPAMETQLIVRNTEDAYISTVLFETVVTPLINAMQPDRFRF